MNISYLQTHRRQVTVIHRRDEFRASRVMLQRAQQTENISFLLKHTVEEWRPAPSPRPDEPPLLGR
jgi:thioredoxin reductase